MFLAVRFSRRRSQHQMDPLMLLWKQTLNPLPSHRSSVCHANIASSTHTEPFSSILKWPSLNYLSTNCTLTWGFSHCRLLIYSGMKSVRFVRFQLMEKRDGHATSSRKWKQSAVLYRAVTFVVFRMLNFFVKHAHWPLTYIFPQRPRKGYRG